MNGYKVDLPYKSLLIKLVKLQARNLDKSLPKVKYWEKHDAQCDSLLQVEFVYIVVYYFKQYHLILKIFILIQIAGYRKNTGNILFKDAEK